MPQERLAVPAKRKGPAFKPPRPTAKPKEATSKTVPHRNPAPVRPVLPLSSSEDEATSEPSQISDDEARNDPSSQNAPLNIPPKLLTKLLHHHFQDQNMRIGKDANALVGKYMDTFVREAIARAAFERSEAESGSGRGGDFLEVEDLEKLAPQLILDF